MYHHRVTHLTSRTLGVIVGGVFLCLPLATSAEVPSHAEQHPAHQAMSHQLPAWAEQLKGQTIVEDTIEGRPDRAAMVDQHHQRVMEQLNRDPQVQQVNTGMFNTSSMMHQYGAGGQDMLLMSDPRVEPVAVT